ncbi:MAG: DUF3187 family protein [Gammaproteobacteria bacterium]
MSAVAAAILGVVVVSGQARADEFFATRDQNPLLRGFYLPLPSAARRDAEAVVSATLLVSNTLNVETHAHETLLVDGESTAIDLTYENSLAADWRYRLSVPIIHDSGGILDSVIDVWHQGLGLSRGNRPFYPKRQLDYSYSGAASIDLHHSQTSVGDFAADVGWYAVDDARRTLSVWGGLKAPTGNVADLTSDGAWDGALWVHGAMRWPKWQLAAELGVAQPFGDEIFAGAAHRDSVFGRFAATRAVGRLWSLRAQLDGQTGRVTGSELRFLGPSLQLTLGAARALKGRWRIEMGFAEDVAVNTAPDITFFLGIHD